MNRSWRKAWVAGCVASVTLALCVWISWRPTSVNGPLAGVLAALGGASALAVAVCLADALRYRRAFWHVQGGGAALSTGRVDRQALRERRHHETVAGLRRQLEQLSAIRDLALIANDDVQLERVLERSLEVLGGLLGAREIAIFLVEGPEQRLEPVAQRLGNTVKIRGLHSMERVKAREADRAHEVRRTTVKSARGQVRVGSLLVADGEVIGALEVRIPEEALFREVRELAREVESLAKHIALAIRKPTLYDRAVVDGLTRLYTKRHFQEQVGLHMAQRRRLGTPLSLVILDVDHFKQVNDVHGHVAGDLVLAEVARRVQHEIRAYDQAFRYGGEEVVVLAPNTPLDEAVGLAERLRVILRDTPIDTGETQLTITASFGVAEFDPDAHADAPALVEAADQHLYTAQRSGRDQVQPQLTAAPAQAA